MKGYVDEPFPKIWIDLPRCWGFVTVFVSTSTSTSPKIWVDLSSCWDDMIVFISTSTSLKFE